MKIVIITLGYLLFPLLIIAVYKKFAFAKKVGTVMLAYAVGIIPALCGWLQMDGADSTSFENVQKWIMNLSVPIAIPLMLFNCNFKLWTKSLPKTTAAFFGGMFSIIIAVVSGFFIFKNTGIDDIANISGMMTAIYTGGTMNFYALGSSLQVDPNTITLVYTFEMLVTFPLILFIVSGGYKLFRKILPYKDESVSLDPVEVQNEDTGLENYSGIFTKKVFPKMLLGLAISILFLGIGAGLSFLITGKLNELIIILTITTLASGASFSKKIRELPKTFELGMFFILIFSIVVASQFNIQSVDSSALTMLYFVLYIMFTSVILHLLISRLFKVSGDLFGVAHIGLLCSPPFIPPIVAAMGNKKVLISGIVIGLIGYAVGTYLGVALAWCLNLLI
ncbi:MAG: DUF819 family protein [Bacteroidales bacterium]|nr:DUF819 family protein [Bacteroidales bacterium]